MAKKFAAFFGTLFTIFLSLWFALLELYLSFILILAVFLARKFAPLRKFKTVILIISVLLSLVSVEFFYRTEKWSQAMRTSPDTISDANLAGLYIFHGVMTMFGYLPFPEVGREAFILQFSDGKSQTWGKDLSRISDKISKLAIAHERKLSKEGQTTKTKLRWKHDELRTYSEIRAALAVGCEKAFLKSQKLKDGFSHTVFCHVSYPNSRMQIARVGGHRLYFDEGLFLLLEKKGWFHPFDVRWKWKTLEKPDAYRL